MQSVGRVLFEDRVLDGPASGEKGPKSKNPVLTSSELCEVGGSRPLNVSKVDNCLKLTTLPFVPGR